MAEDDWSRAVREAIMAYEGPAFLVVGPDKFRPAQMLNTLGGKREFVDDDRNGVTFESRVIVLESKTIAGDSWALVPRAWNVRVWAEGEYRKMLGE